MTDKGQTRPRGTANKVTWAQAVRDIVISSINRGQLPVLAVAGVIGVLAWRMPPSEIPALLNKILDHLETGKLLGWLLSLILVFSWYAHSRSMRKQFSGELERISKAKTQAQEAAAQKKLQGSQGKKR